MTASSYMNNDSIRFIIHQWRQDIVVELLSFSTTKRSKDSFTLFKVFVEIISLNSFYVIITHSKNYTAIFDNTGTVTVSWYCKRHKILLGNYWWFIQAVFYSHSISCMTRCVSTVGWNFLRYIRNCTCWSFCC